MSATVNSTHKISGSDTEQANLNLSIFHWRPQTPGFKDYAKHKTATLRTTEQWKYIRVTILSVEKQYIFVSTSVLALVIRHANLIIYESIALSSEASWAVSYFLTVSHKLHDFLKKIIEYKMCVFLSVQILPEIFIIVR